MFFKTSIFLVFLACAIIFLPNNNFEEAQNLDAEKFTIQPPRSEELPNPAFLTKTGLQRTRTLFGLPEGPKGIYEVLS